MLVLRTGFTHTSNSTPRMSELEPYVLGEAASTITSTGLLGICTIGHRVLLLSVGQSGTPSDATTQDGLFSHTTVVCVFISHLPTDTSL